MKPKQWLYDNGHIAKVGQGRISAENKDRIRAAIEANPNLFIEGYSATTPVPDKGTAVAKPAVESAGMVEYREPRRDKREWEASAVVDGKRHTLGMADGCQNCRSSLSYCHCKVSVAVVYTAPGMPNSVVDFTPKV